MVVGRSKSAYQSCMHTTAGRAEGGGAQRRAPRATLHRPRTQQVNVVAVEGDGAVRVQALEHDIAPAAASGADADAEVLVQHHGRHGRSGSGDGRWATAPATGVSAAEACACGCACACASACVPHRITRLRIRRCSAALGTAIAAGRVHATRSVGAGSHRQMGASETHTHTHIHTHTMMNDGCEGRKHAGRDDRAVSRPTLSRSRAVEGPSCQAPSCCHDGALQR